MTLRAVYLVWLGLMLCLSACGDELTPRDYGDPTSLATPSEQSGIVAWIVSPRVDAILPNATPEVIVAAHTKEEPYQPLRVLIGRLEKDEHGVDRVVEMRPASPEGEPGPEQRFKVEVPLLHGLNRLLVRVQTEDQSRVRRLVYALDYRGQAPGLRLSVRAPQDGTPLEQACEGETEELNAYVTAKKLVCVFGQTSTSENGGSVSASVGLSGFSRGAASVSENGEFAMPVSLAEDRVNVIEVELKDGAGETTLARVPVVHDGRPPELDVKLTPPSGGENLAELSGTATDPYGISAVEVHTESGSVLRLGSAPTFTTTLRLAVGENHFTVVARDLAGNETREEVSLRKPRVIWLGAPKRDAGATQIDLTRFDLEELLTPENQQSLSVVQVGLRAPIKEALLRIREPERFGVDTSEWGTAERNLQRILNMTPDTADLSGTSVEELLSIANAVGLPSPRMLAELLSTGVTDFIVDLDVAADVLSDKLVGTHPNIEQAEDGEYVLDISLYDVFQNLTTLAARFGPEGGHPGIMDGESYSAVLEPGFLISLPVSSNLVQFDAVDLSRGAKDFLFLLDGERVLDFDTLTDDFTVVGLKDEPTVDLRIKLLEHPGANMLLAGNQRNARPDEQNAGFYRGNGQAFDVSPWYFEHTTAEIGYRMFFQSFANKDYKNVLRYDAGAIKDAAVINWDRGWVTITTAGGVGAPPPPLYAWDLLMEVAQVRLHDNGIPEGQAEMAFSLTDLSIGLTADQLVERLRPRLAEQQTELSELLVGDVGLATSNADIFYVPREGGGTGYLLFRAPEDGEGEYTYPHVGFFEDASFTKKASSVTPIPGVTNVDHEVVPAKVGAEYFVADEQGNRFRLEVVAQEGERVGVLVGEVGVLQ